MTDLLCLYPENPESSRFKVICKRGEYSASRIAHAVEDCDAHVLNLNVTAEKLHDNYGDGLVVDLRVEHRNAVSVIRSLERYGYTVIPLDVNIADGERADDDAVEMSALERFLSI
jgi:hypothetical protein